MFKDKIRLTIICIFTIALLPRLFLAFSSHEIPVHDAGGYDLYALNLLENKGFSQVGTYREPLYPFFLAFIYWLFGHSYMAVRIIQSISGALICVIIFLISKKISDYKVALISGLLACLNPSFIRIIEHLFSENLYTFLLVMGTYFFVKQTQEKDYKNLIFLGVILGLAALTRAIIFFFPVFIIIFMGKSLGDRNYTFKKHLLSIVILLFFFVLPIAPWTVRNWRLKHRFIPITSRTAEGLYCSYFPKEGKLFGFDGDDETTKKAKLIKSDTERDAFFLKEIIKYIRNNPLRVLRLEILKVAYFWSPFDWEVIGYGVYNFMFGFIFPFFISLARSFFEKKQDISLFLETSIIPLISFQT